MTSTTKDNLVFLVEDEVGLRMVAVDGLEDAGYRVLEAGSAAEALQILESRGDVGVLFTEINMPGALDGLSLAELVHRRWPQIKLVVTSGRGLPDDGRFLNKPYSLEEMTRVIAIVSSSSDEAGADDWRRGRETNGGIEGYALRFLNCA